MEIIPLDEDGQPIDWWFLYKVPRLTGSAGSVPEATGYEYAYYDPTKKVVEKSPNLLNSKAGALNLTLNRIFAAPDATTGWILYNDEEPPTPGQHDNGSLGHTKGVIAFDIATNTALWILHSWPKYVAPTSTAMPTPMYGQTFLCMSLSLADARSLAALMTTHQQPQVFAPRLPDALPVDDPLRLLTGTINPADAADAQSIQLSTRGYQGAPLPFKVIAKNRDWNKDFWNDLVGPTIEEDINVETWIRGPIAPQLDSDGIHKTFDIKYISLKPLGLPWAWPETSDHAKWALSHADNWVCVGDINRMISQRQRGGGTIAFQEPTLWAALNQTDLLVLPPGMTFGQTVGRIHNAPPE